MCGVVMVHARRGAPLDPRRVAAMRDAMTHRGPDDAGLWLSPAGDFALGHRRLAILDLSPAGHQPMASPAGTLLCYNGEIYNYLELKADYLPDRPFASTSDSEVLLALLEQRGVAALPLLNGMWGLVWYDPARRVALISRDRFGVKPLYWYQDGEVTIVASEIKAILAWPGVTAREDAAVCRRFLDSGQLDGGEETLFRGIRRFPAASWAEYRLDTGELVPRPFYRIGEAPPQVARDPRENAERFHALFLDSVRLRMRSDVPVGVCLSGGLDSSAIYSVAARHCNPAIQAFSNRFDDPACDESVHYRRVIAGVGGRGHEVTPDPARLMDELPRLIHHLEEPSKAMGVIGQWHVIRLAAGHVKVLLNGQGGDEVLGGYDSDHPYRLADALGRGPGDVWHTLRGTWEVKGAGLLWPLCKGAARAWVRRLPRAGGSFLAAHLLDAVTSSSLPALLRYEDRIGMAFSLESRMPFLDWRLVELAFALGPEEKIDAGWSKLILRRAMAAELPEAVVWRRDKLGFPTPLGRLLAANPALARAVPAGVADPWVQWRHVALQVWRQVFGL